MANQTVTTTVNYDDSTISGLLNGETITINGGSVTINSDVRWNQQAAVFGSVTLSASLGGVFNIDGTDVWELSFDASTGNVPTQDVYGGANGVTGSGGATGELLRVWASGSLTPEAAGGAMPATGWIKLRSKTGNFADNEVVTLPGGATITLTGPGKRSWIHVVAREATALTIPRLASCTIEGDWYELGTTDGTDGQTFQFPVADECLAVQVETAPGSGTYEWWVNGGSRWAGIANISTPTATNATNTADAIAGPLYLSDPYGYANSGTRMRETTTNAPHSNTSAMAASNGETGIYTFRTYLKKETRRWGWVQAASNGGAIRYTVLIDFDASGSVVATQTVGTPVNTPTHTVTNAGNGWYLVELTLEHTSIATTASIFVGTSNSATPTYTTGQPSFAGLTTEGMYFSELQVVVPSSIVQMISSTDARGKYFFSNPTTGILTFAQRTGQTAGLKPTSGCKVRIPNIILSSASAIDYPKTTQNATAATRYDTSITGFLNIRNACCNWYLLATNSFQVDVRDSAVWAISASNIASTTNIQNCGFGISRDIDIQPITIANCFSGGTLTDLFVARRQGTGANAAVISFTTCAAFNITRVRTDMFGFTARNVKGLATVRCHTLTNCADFTLTDCSTLGAGVVMATCVRMNILNHKYADVVNGLTVSGINIAAIVITTSCNNLYIDGFAAFDNLNDVHPMLAIVSATTNIDTLEVRNIGTPSAPYLGGDTVINANRMINAIVLSATCLNVTLRRIYTQNLQDGASGTVGMAIVTAVTNQNVRAINVWGDADEPTVVANVNQLNQGCRWSNSNTVTSAVFGTHWEDAFTGLTSGRITISGNEPLASTTNQCSFTFGANAGFNSAGGTNMPNLGDEIVWTMPYYAIGHTGIAQFTYGTSTTENWFMTGVNQQNFEYEYQIDKNDGGGFSAWKPLLDMGRRSAGGGSGTNTVTITAADWDAMTNKPQIGYYVTTASASAITAKVPAGTTITNIVGYVLTLSNNFTAAMASNELVYFWKDIADEVIDPEDGYKLKVKCRANTANSTNEFRFLRIPFDTDSVNQQLQYPLPVTQNVGSITDIRPGSRLQVFNVTTDTEVTNEVVAGDTFTYPYDEGTDFTAGDVIRVRLARCLGPTASIGYETFALATSTGWAVLAAQSDDEVYNANGIDGTTVTEFTADYPNNIEVDIDDPDGETSVARLYAWFANERTTEEGIRRLIGGILAEDQANYKINTNRIDLKLDNVAATGVIFTGDLRLYRDDGAAPVVSSTSGGGSITLYAGKVYIAETGTSGLTAAETAKLDQISNLALETTAQAALKAAKTAVALSA